MGYNIKKLSPESLNKIYLVLKDIKDRSEIANNTKILNFGYVNGLRGVSKIDHKIIMKNLIDYGYVSIPFHFYSGECGININKKFYRFFKLVKNIVDGNKKISNKLSFDNENSILLLNGQSIKIARQSKKTVAHEILEYIFSHDVKDQNFYSDISDCYDRLKDYHNNPKAWRKLYIACKDIQEKVRKQTKEKVDDFLIFNSGKKGKVQINPKYL